eukprot:105471_1
MNQFILCSDRDLLNISTVETRNFVNNEIIIAWKSMFQVNIYDLFLCNNPENESCEHLLKNINNKIVNNFINERKMILNDLYPDLRFPPDFWNCIYMDFEFGDIYYR